jgi:hypothetical protein
MAQELEEPELRISLSPVLDPSWNATEAVRLGEIPRGGSEASFHVLAEQGGRRLLHVDVWTDPDEYHFKSEALEWRGWLAIGTGHRVYLVRLEDRRTVLVRLRSYFQRFEVDTEHLLIVCGQGLGLVDTTGRLVWLNEDLAVDGIVVHAIEGGVIHGDAELDPPGGWKPFAVALSDGRAVQPGT